MTLSLGARATAAVTADVLVPAPFVKLTTYSDREAETVDLVFWISDAPRLYDYDGTDREFIPALGGVTDVVEETEHVTPDALSDGETIGRGVTLTLSDAPVWDPVGAAMSTLRAMLMERNLSGASIEWSEVLLAPWEGEDRYDLRGLGAAAREVVWAGVVDDVAPQGSDIQLRCRRQLLPMEWVYISDATSASPRDLGRRLPFPVGEPKRVPLPGLVVGSVATLATGIADGASTDEFVISDEDQIGEFPSSGNFDVRVSGEEMTVTRTGATETGGIIPVTRGINGTRATGHSVGEVLAEMISEVTLGVSQNAGANLRALYVRNPLNDTLYQAPTIGAVNANDSGTISGRTITTTKLTSAELRNLLDSAIKAAEVTQQPEFDSGTAPTTGTEAYDTLTNIIYPPPLGNVAEVTVNGAGRITSTGAYGVAGRIVGQKLTFTGLPSTAVAYARFSVSGTIFNADPGVEATGIFVAIFDDVGALQQTYSKTTTATSIGVAHTFPILPGITSLDELEDWSMRVYLTGVPSTHVNSYAEVSLVSSVINYETDTGLDRLSDVEIAGFNNSYDLEWFGDVDGPSAPAIFASLYDFEAGTGWNDDEGSHVSDTTTFYEGSTAQRFDVDAPTQRLSFDSDVSNWTATGGTISDEATIVQEGSGSLQHTKTVGPGEACYRNNLAQDWSGHDRVSFWVQVDDVTKLVSTNTIRLVVSTDVAAGFLPTNYSTFTIDKADIGLVDDEYLKLTFDLTAPDLTGGTPWTNASTVRFVGLQAVDQGSGSLTVYWDDLQTWSDVSRMQKNNLSTLDWSADNDVYQLAVRVSDLTGLASAKLYFSDTAGSGTTPPAARRELTIPLASLMEDEWTVLEITAADEGSPDETSVQTVGLEVTVDGSLDAVQVWIDDLQGADDSSNPYEASVGAVLQHPVDLVRYLLAETAGLPAAQLADPSSVVTALGAGAEMDGELSQLGVTLERILQRMAFEAGFQIHRRADGTFRLLSADSSLDFGAAVSTITEWQDFQRLGLRPDEVATSVTALWDFDPSIDTIRDESRFRSTAQANPTTSDVATYWTTTNAGDAVERYGPVPTQTLALLLIRQAALAERTLGYVAQEYGRGDRDRFSILGVPWWQAADREAGDVIQATPPWETSARKLRILTIRTDGRTRLRDLDVVEVT